MRIVSNKALRRLAHGALRLAPRKYQVGVDRWLRGRQEFRKLQAADFVIVSLGKSGRTWLRTMISRYFQVKFGLPEGSIIGFDNFHKLKPAIPKIFFTHDHYLKFYTRNSATKAEYYNKKIVLLVRDPRDVAVSNYFQRKYRASDLSRKLHADLGDDITLFDYVTRHSIPRGTAFMNTWAGEMPEFASSLVVRYEDLRRNSAEHMQRILEFLGQQPSAAEIEDLVSYARFEAMKKREQSSDFQSEGRRLFGGDAANPDSFKVRRGKVGGYRDYFSDEEVNAIDRLVEESLVSLYGYH